MAFKKIGLIGVTGLLGAGVTRALVEEGFEVVPFSRQKTEVAGLPTQQLTASTSFKGLDVVISLVGPEGWKDQLEWIQRAKADGVKRFIPSEWGMDHRGQEVAYVKPKEEALKAAQAAEFPDGWTGFINGFFEVVVAKVCQWDLEKGVVQVVGKGTTQYPWVFVYDVGRAVAATLKATPDQFKNRWVLSASAWASVNEIADWVEEAAGRKLSREYVPPGANAPIVSHLEEHGGNVFDRNDTTDLGIEWTDFKSYVQSLVKPN